MTTTDSFVRLYLVNKILYLLRFTQAHNKKLANFKIQKLIYTTADTPMSINEAFKR